jgi:hypothetical protein
MMHTLPVIKVELSVEVSFETFGQVYYTDENGRSWIKEFVGPLWSTEIFLKQPKEIILSVFVNNQYLQKGRSVKLTKKIDNEIIDQQEFLLTGDKLFEGWFKLV